MSKFFCAIVLMSAALLSACKADLPAAKSENYKNAVRSFYVGLAAMQVGDDARARTELETATKLAVGEPAAWANLGILQMRQKDFEASEKSFDKALELAPGNGQIYANKAVLSIQRGSFEDAVISFEKAIELDPKDAKNYYGLARERERLGNDAESLLLFEQVLELKPENVPVILEIVRLTAKLNDIPKMQRVFQSLASQSPKWDAEVKTRYEELRKSVESGDIREIPRNIGFFRNVLVRLPEFRSAIADVRFDDTTVGEPFLKPLRLSVPELSIAPPDTDLSFEVSTVSNSKAIWSKAVFLDGEAPPVNVWADNAQIHIGEKTLAVNGSRDLLTIDIDYNFKNDFVSTGSEGLRFFKDSFEEITGKTNLPAEVLGRSYTGSFAFDIEIDGDLDLILASESGPPVVLQNNADGTFKQIEHFSEILNLRKFESADLDEDGDMDAVFVDSDGKLRIFTNERGGQFRIRETPSLKSVAALAVADINGDGRLGLNLLDTDGVLTRLSDKNSGEGWESEEVLRGKIESDPTLILQDLDNSGSIDVLISDQIWLNGGNGNISQLNVSLNGRAYGAFDFDGDGKLDLAGLDKDGNPAKFKNLSKNNYAWQVFRPRSANAMGDQRVNSFGIGGEMEIRSGLLPQKRVISAPQIHFGLGEHPATDVLRVIWGNGFIQAEFDLQKDQQILVKQRLTGSCPHLFAWNGFEFALVKDAAPLGTSLGLKISEDEVLPVTQTRESYKISGDQLAAKEGFYELRITDELWESYYVDHYSLVAVDHPENTELFVNELYPIPAGSNSYTGTKPRSFTRSTDQTGSDVSNLVNELDEVYLDTFEPANYQGVAKDHFVELELPEDISQNSKISIIADGWLHPTDTSLNVAISQSSHKKPKSLSLDVLSHTGSWQTVKEDFGVPAGKLKTIVVELPAGTKRARLRTNMEIYWDRLAWTEMVSDTENETHLLDLGSAELRYRGFSVIGKKDRSSPEIPDYGQIATTVQRWRPIEGYYTRHGDILELLLEPDDRYAIVNTGDEMILKFPALPQVRAGYERDFIFIGEGWIKEGDYNNVFSKTVLPLPTRLSGDYSKPPESLEQDPVYQRNPGDWQRFHNRYIAPESFRNALRLKK